MREFVLILPEVILALTLAFIVAAEISYHGERTRLVAGTAQVGLAAAFVQTLITYQYSATQIFDGALAIDGLSLFFKVLFIILASLTLWTTMQSREIAKERQTEFFALVLASTLAMSLAAGAADLLLAFLCLQFMNIVGYFLAGFGKRSIYSAEAAVKYMVFSSVAAALFLYGLAVLFALTHGFNIYEIHKALVTHPLTHSSMLVVFMLIFLALSFQLSAFPMYLWTPDVLEGAPTSSSGFLSFGVRAAGVAVTLRFLIVMFAQRSDLDGQWQILGALDWTRIVALVSGMTMLIGSLLAVRQTAAKRMVGCLVVAQTGFLLMGVLVLDQVGVAALLYNLVVEVFALMGSFFVLAFFFDELGSDSLEGLRGMLSRAVPECGFLVLFLLCLIGLPPTPGFVGKFALIGAVVRHHWHVLAVVAIAAMTLSTAAVARMAFYLVGDFRAGSLRPGSYGKFITPSRGRQAFLVGVMVPVVMLGVFAEFVLNWAGKSLGFILW
ncbi:proton-conducting transporter membrane subunit [Bdellovibrionota bacterium FG-1]